MEGKIIGEKDKKEHRGGQSYSLLPPQNFLGSMLLCTKTLISCMLIFHRFLVHHIYFHMKNKKQKPK